MATHNSPILSITLQNERDGAAKAEGLRAFPYSCLEGCPSMRSARTYRNHGEVGEFCADRAFRRKTSEARQNVFDSSVSHLPVFDPDESIIRNIASRIFAASRAPIAAKYPVRNAETSLLRLADRTGWIGAHASRSVVATSAARVEIPNRPSCNVSRRTI